MLRERKNRGGENELVYFIYFIFIKFYLKLYIFLGRQKYYNVLFNVF